MDHYYNLADAMRAVQSFDDVVVRVEDGRSYYIIYNSIEKLAEDIENSPTSRAYHEITRIEMNPFAPAQRLYFDIDMKVIDITPECAKNYEQKCIDEIVRTVNDWRGHPVKANIMHSSDYTTKISLHIIFPEIKFKSHYALKHLAVDLRNKLEPWLANCVDILYKRNQGLRLAFCNKVGTSRRKVQMNTENPITDSTVLRDNMIHEYGSEPTDFSDSMAPLPKVIPMSESLENVSRAISIIHNLEEAGGDENGGHREGKIEYHNGKPSMVALVRSRPSWCPLCERVHESENYYITIRQSGEYYLNCWRVGGAEKKASAKLIYVDLNMNVAYTTKKEVAAKRSKTHKIATDDGRPSRRIIEANEESIVPTVVRRRRLIIGDNYSDVNVPIFGSRSIEEA